MTVLQARSMSASQVLDDYWDGLLPVNPIKVAEARGITVRRSQHLSPYSGVIEILNGEPLITYNGTDSPVRQRFTIAHEIGHYALGHLENANQPLYRDPSANFSSSARAPEERTANSFAAQLLMPARTLSYAVSEKGISSIERLAEVFGVSQVAMKYRLTNLGLVSD